ncbi:hypothetical protein [Roseibium sp.]|uniref:hypothetical protein n=1 Tax=Roseibium sp. TaxID=1936156 RepID=UPI003A97074F
MSRQILSIPSLLLSLSLFCGGAAAAGSSPMDFDLVIAPAMDKTEKSANGYNVHTQRDAIVYRFRGQTVTSEWAVVSTIKEHKYTGHFTMTGTFRDGVLTGKIEGEIEAHTKRIAPGNAPTPDKPFWVGYYTGAVHGTVSDGTNLQLQTTEIIYREKFLTSRAILDSSGKATGYKWVYTERKPQGRKPELKDYSLVLPIKVEATVWYQSPYFTASGEQDDRLGWMLDRLSGQMEALSQNLLKGIVPLARQQWQSLRASLQDLQAEMADKDNVSLSLSATPADAAIDQISRLEELSTAYVELHKVALTQNNHFLHTVEDLKLNFINNVGTITVQSFLSWTNVIPTDMYAGLEGYSLESSLFALPRTLASWQRQAQKDASLLKDQTTTIRMMEAYADYWSDVAETCLKENRKIHDRFQAIKKDEVLSLTSEITDFSSGLQF